MSHMIEQRYMDVNDCAIYIGRTPKAVRRLIDRAEIPAIRTGRKLQFDKEQIDRWMQRHAVRGKQLWADHAR